MRKDAVPCPALRAAASGHGIPCRRLRHWKPDEGRWKAHGQKVFSLCPPNMLPDERKADKLLKSAIENTFGIGEQAAARSHMFLAARRLGGD